MVILTLQKLAPAALMISFVGEGDLVVLIVACFSALIGSFGGLKEGNVMGVMGWSSIRQRGWLVAACAGNVWVAVIFFLVYVYQVGFLIVLLGRGRSRSLKVGDLRRNGFSAVKRCCVCVFLLSIGGIPPTLGFFRKVIVFSEVVELTGGVIVCSALVISRAIRMFFYLRIVFRVAEEGVVRVRGDKYEAN